MTELYLGSISQQEIRDFLNDSAAEDEKKTKQNKKSFVNDIPFFNSRNVHSC